MRQIVPFVKDLSFNTQIYEITSIALEHDLKIENNDSIVGEFIVSGKYRINELSINEEDFDEKMEIDITLDDKYDALSAKIDIDNFYYEIVNDNVLRVHIDVSLDNLSYLKKETVINDKELEIIKEEPKEILEILPKEAKIEDNNNDKENNNLRGDEVAEEQDTSLDNTLSKLGTDFTNLEDNYVMYKVHIIRNNETVEELVSLYNVTKDEIEKYNDLSNITIGDKIIIPSNE